MKLATIARFLYGQYKQRKGHGYGGAQRSGMPGGSLAGLAGLAAMLMGKGRPGHGSHGGHGGYGGAGRGKSAPLLRIAKMLYHAYQKNKGRSGPGDGSKGFQSRSGFGF